MWKKILEALARFKAWIAEKWAAVRGTPAAAALPPPEADPSEQLLLGMGHEEVNYWLTEDVAKIQYALIQFSDVLRVFGLPMLPEPADPLDKARPGIPPVHMPVLYVRAPPTQKDLLLAEPHCDPTHLTVEGLEPVPPGGEARRLLSILRINGIISGWYAFLDDDGHCGIHIQLDRSQAAAWFSLIDWQNKSVFTGLGKANKHAFF